MYRTKDKNRLYHLNNYTANSCPVSLHPYVKFQRNKKFLLYLISKDF